MAMNRKLIPRTAVEQITRGSLEHQIDRVREAVRVALVFGEELGLAHLVATFPGYAIVGTESGKFFRVKVESAEDGSVQLLNAENYPVPVYDESNIQELINRKVDAAVESVVNNTGSINSMLLEVAELISIGAKSAVDQAKELVAAVEDVSRPWKKIFQQHGSRIRKTVESVMPEIRMRLPRLSKFSPLYSGTGSIAEMRDVAGLLKVDLNSHGKKIAEIVSTVATEYSKFCAVEAKFRTPDDAAVVESFKKFAEDFMDDSSMISEALLELSKTEEAFAERGFACDIVAAKMENIEVAAAFIGNTLKKTQESMAA